jgi:hypothetical protein
LAAYAAARAIALAAEVVVPRTTPGSSTSGSSVDQELRLQLPRLQLPKLGLVEPVPAPVHVQLQLESANPAAWLPEATLQLDRLQLESE